MAGPQVPEQPIAPERAAKTPTILSANRRRKISAPLDVPVLLERLAELLGLIAPSAPAMVFLHDAASNRYTMRRGVQGLMSPGESELSFGIDSSIVRWLGAQDHPLHLENGESRPPSPFDSMGMLLFIPLQGHWGLPEDRPRGWVALGPRSTGEPYSPDDLSLLAALVDQVALAIENSFLRESIDELDQAQAEFIDFVAHELKQPMTAMQGYAKMLLMGIAGELSDQQSQFVDVINANVGRMGKLVNDLLEISRLEADRIKLKPEQLQPREIIDGALAATRAEMETREHSLKIHVPEELPPFPGDRERLVQVLVILLSNACMYTTNGGRIGISVDGPDGAGVPPGHLLFSVSDTGIGMSSEQLASLDKFFRADHDLVISQPGTGLGLSIARHLVALHAGVLMVVSDPDHGSTFSFTVPVAPASDP
jgi:signal transduction histidine kinase